jgi:hypothetical protein
MKRRVGGLKRDDGLQGHKFEQEIIFELRSRQLVIPERKAELAWLRGWREHPGRLFWEFDLETWTWKRL